MALARLNEHIKVRQRAWYPPHCWHSKSRLQVCGSHRHACGLHVKHQSFRASCFRRWRETLPGFAVAAQVKWSVSKCHLWQKVCLRLWRDGVRDLFLANEYIFLVSRAVWNIDPRPSVASQHFFQAALLRLNYFMCSHKTSQNMQWPESLLTVKILLSIFSLED